MDFLIKEYLKKINLDTKRLNEFGENLKKNENIILNNLSKLEEKEKFFNFKTIVFFETIKENLKEKITLKKIIKMINLFYDTFIFSYISNINENDFLEALEKEKKSNYISTYKICKDLDEIFELIFGILKNSQRSKEYFECLKNEYILNLKEKKENTNQINFEINFIEYERINFFLKNKFKKFKKKEKFEEIVKYYFFTKENQEIFNKKNLEKVHNFLTICLKNYEENFINIEKLFFEINSSDIITEISDIKKISLIRNFKLLERKK